MIFADTSGLYAAVREADEHHLAAITILHAILPTDHQIVTTNYVVVELLALLQRRAGVAEAARAVEELFPVLEIGFFSEELHALSMRLWLEKGRRNLSFLDCSSITYMKHLKISRAFAFDRDFERFGIKLVTEQGCR